MSDAFTQAVHIGLTCPIECRQGGVRTQEIGFGIDRHLHPVNAAHILAPAQNLPDESLDRVQRRRAIPTGVKQEQLWRLTHERLMGDLL